MKIRYKTNLCGGIFSILLGIGLLLLIPQAIARDSKWSIQYGVTSRTVPQAAAWVMIAAGAALLFKSLILKKDEVKELDLSKEARGLIYMVMMGIFAFIFQYSYILATLFLGEGTLVLMKAKKPLYYIIVAVLIGILYVLFSVVMKVRLPVLFL